MKIVKRIIALVMVAILSLSLVGCLHKKNEIAVTIGDNEFTSAYYMCALVNANMEGKQKVYESLTADQQKEEINYYSKKIDKKSFVDWVEDRAIEIIKEIASYKSLCAKNEVKLSDDLKAEAEQNVTTMWDYYGYSAYYEPNGVSRDTYAKFTEDSYYSEAYFQYLYGRGGKKELAEDKVITEITKNYVLLDKLSITYETDATAEEKAAAKGKLDGYAAQIKKGEKTFIQIYQAHNEMIEEEISNISKNEDAPVNTYATVSGAEGTSFEDANFKTYEKYEVDVPQVVENSANNGYELIIKRDIMADNYFVDYLDSFARHTLADEDFKKEIDANTKKLEVEINAYATKQFKVKKIVEPEA